MSVKSTKLNVRKLTYLAIFTTLVFVLQLISLLMRGPMFSLTFVLVPIVIAVAMCGIAAGPWLGFVFGVAVLVSGDAALFLTFNPLATVFLVLLKGTLAGLAAALVYKALAAKFRYLAVILAAITAPIVNTGVFFFGCLVFFYNDIITYFSVQSGAAISFIITGLIGINFIIEVAVNLIFVPTIYRIINIKQKL